MINDDPQELNEDDEFSFVCANPYGPPISADDAFFNGQIRPALPVFDQRLVSEQKPAPSDRNRLPKPSIPEEPSRMSPELCRRSYSTGFLSRFRDVIRRSNSDGGDSNVFSRNPSVGSAKSGKEKKTEKLQKSEQSDLGKKMAKKKGETASFVHERHYARNRAESEVNRRKSFLPYKRNLMAMGLFTRVKGV